jgi:hypothetical protein
MQLEKGSADTDGAFEDLETMILSLDSSSAILYRRSWDHAVLHSSVSLVVQESLLLVT